MNTPIILSILIPAFERPAAIERIFNMLVCVKADARVEIIVSDDSLSDSVAHEIELITNTFPHARYHRSSSALGAVLNWNSLLDAARGSYCWVLHHDEAPADMKFAVRLLQVLAIPSAADVVLLACHVIQYEGAKPLRHFKVEWTKQVARFFPNYLLRRNLIGSPSSVVVRKSAYPRFDSQLKFYVDVDLYYRLLQAYPSVQVLHGISLLSFKDDIHSITASMKHELAIVKRNELDYLAKKYTSDHMAKWVWSRGMGARMIRLFESTGWFLFRSVDRICAHVQAARMHLLL
jgi:glycosyltransferase involved in cell wall biosynthesis